jgi:ribosomal protein L37AE/L43A
MNYSVNPCRECGSPAVLDRTEEDSGVVEVKCLTCGQTVAEGTYTGAIIAWNLHNAAEEE